MQNSFKKYTAEFIGTLILVLMGCGSVVIGDVAHTHLEIALCFGLTLTGLIYTLGSISGCHLNPAVTLAMLVLKKTHYKDAFGYVVAQCLGAISGAGFIYMICLGDPNYNIVERGLGQNFFTENDSHGYNLFIAFFSEVFFTALLVMVILATTSGKSSLMAGMIIGLILVVIHIVGISITGVSVNPARSFGPAIFVGGQALEQLWVFVFAPFTGGLFAALVWNQIELDKKLDRLIEQINN